MSLHFFLMMVVAVVSVVSVVVAVLAKTVKLCAAGRNEMVEARYHLSR